MRGMGEPRDQNRFLVRMPDGMRDRIRDAAETNSRSMNSEIIARIESSFDAPDWKSAFDEAMNDVREQNRILAEQAKLIERLSNAVEMAFNAQETGKDTASFTGATKKARE